MDDRFTAPHGGREAARCALCGVTLPTGSMVPDGGAACADIRWYCRDVLSCTQRWTTRRPAAVSAAAPPAALTRPEPGAAAAAGAVNPV
ncbi:MAG TPA: hypothetical protein VHF26_25635 [Trebonia sp.]|nr:hypothetical protein [Trebonia sp.]